MKRYAEVVLNGHPDKFCDLLADALIREAYAVDQVAFAQVEASVWSDQLFLTGAIATAQPLTLDTEAIIHSLGKQIGYTESNHIDVTRYQIHDHVCKVHKDSEFWNDYVNDQCIVSGYAGYDALTRFLPPEQFAVWFFRERLVRMLENGSLKGYGPDAKLLIVMEEQGNAWELETLLLSMQHPKQIGFTFLVEELMQALQLIYNQLQEHDARWCRPFQKIKILVNPNGPFIEGGSDGDNGQTGRKLVMDYYGPRIPIGGGALYGKCLTHIDRLASNAARNFALDLMNQGAEHALIQLCYAPGLSRPLDVKIDCSITPSFNPYEHFDSTNLLHFVDKSQLNYDLYGLDSFYARSAN
jgi:S-adenosylmethionine synthetase